MGLLTIRLIGGQSRTILFGRWAAKFFLEGLTFFRSHVLPLPSQLLPLLRGERLKPAPCFAERFLLLGGKVPESLKPLSQVLLLFWRKFTPPLKPFLGLAALFRRHVSPLVHPVEQPFLSLPRHLIPFLAESLEVLLVGRRQLTPG